MKNSWNKNILFGAIGLLLMVGLVYQNCGHVNPTTDSKNAINSTNSNLSKNNGKDNLIRTIVFKDGTKIKFRVPDKETTLSFKDGTKIKVR